MYDENISNERYSPIYRLTFPFFVVAMMISRIILDMSLTVGVLCDTDRSSKLRGTRSFPTVERAALGRTG